jgi:hypothetical protein
MQRAKISTVKRLSGLLAIAASASCYSPQLRDCEISCSAGACPAGLSCEDGVCRVAGFSGDCSSSGSDGGPRDGAGDSSVVDVPADTVCSHTCYGATPSGLSPIGSAGCTTSSNGCTAAYPWLQSMDLCPCSTNTFPVLYVMRSGSTANVAFVGEPFTGQGYRLRVNDVSCLASGVNACPAVAVADCGQNVQVFAWTNVAVTAGVANSFDLYLDDGTSNCTNTPFASFALVP